MIGCTGAIAPCSLLVNGPEGQAHAYPLDALPKIMPIRVASQRVLDAYLE